MSIIRNLERKFREFVPKRINHYSVFLNHLKAKRGLEIGGPSPTFTHKGFLPVYDVMKTLDGCNFGHQTIWEGKLTEGATYKWGNKIGKQFIADGSQLSFILNASYEAILSCHSIEHFANPIKALKEWMRILTGDGYILLVVPHKDKTFDHQRPLTTLTHLLDDYQKDIPESDSTHFDEIIELHDITMDDGVATKEELIERTHNNINNRCVHHHVFNTPLLVQIADYLSLQIIQIEHFNPFNIVMLLQKTTASDNAGFHNPQHPSFQKFPSDHIWP